MVLFSIIRQNRYALPKVAKSLQKAQCRYQGVRTYSLASCLDRQNLGSNVSILRNFHFSKISSAKTVPYLLSDIGEGIKEVTILEWYVKPGDKVNQFDQICEVQSDKASVSITSRYDGVVTRLYHEVEGVAQVGEPLVDIELEQDDEASLPPMDSVVEPSEPSKSSTPVSELIGSSESASKVSQKVLATPAVRRVAAENKVDLHLVTGTGHQGRVLKEDVFNYVKSSSDTQASPKTEDIPFPTTTGSPDTSMSAPGVDQIVKLTSYQKAMHKSMTASLSIPHFTYCDEINMNQLVLLRSQLKKVSKELGIKLTYMPFIIKATSLALAQFPQINAAYRPQDEVIVMKHAHNIGIALDSPQGLIVPNIKNCEKKTVLELAIELVELQQLGANGSLTQAHLTGGSFTLSNIGLLGGTYTKPVINPPEVAIGAMGRSQIIPRYDYSMNVVPTHIMSVSWSADHRVIDGATICRFSNLWKSYLENPQKMLLHLK